MLAEIITQRMEALGMEQRDVARKSGLSPQYISDLVRGKRGVRISATSLRKLALALRVSTSRLESVATAETMSAGAESDTP